MRAYANPFRLRASEQQRDTRTFVRNFGPGVLDFLPEAVWDRLFVVRSAPGGGKTSLMRLFTTEALSLVNERREEFDALAQRLSDLGAMSDDGPTIMGVLLSLDRDYRALVDVGAPADAAVRLFFRLLDTRIVTGVLRAALGQQHGDFPDDIAEVEFVPRQGLETEASGAALHLGGLDGQSIHTASHAAEAQIIDLLDSLSPVDWQEGAIGHTELHSLRLLAAADLRVNGITTASRPLIMFDDGHELAPRQRSALMQTLSSRRPSVAVWYSERLQALESQEVLAGNIEGRDHSVLHLESAARGSGRQAHGRRARFEKLVLEIGNLRAARTLERAEESDTEFSEYLDIASEPTLGPHSEEILVELHSELTAAAAGEPRYEAWQSEAGKARGYRGAVRIQELEILVARDRKRAQQEFFPFELTEQDADRLSDASLRDAAELFVTKRYKLPYYSGPEVISRLASQNIEQFLTLSGDLFEQMLADITLGRRPALTAARQDAVVRRASDRLWRELPLRIPNGRDVRTLLTAISRMAVAETYRPTAPYAPGVTGTAITMTDRQKLLDPDIRRRIPGGERLHAALASAIAFNILSADLDQSVKNKQFMVLYMNRLLLPRFHLPLNRGGFRERPVETLAAWIRDARADLDRIQGSLEMA